LDEPAAPEPIGDGGLVRVRLGLAYDGTDFSGWARQPGRRSVEETLAAALGVLLRLPEPPRLVVAGRTDAGVHASGQVAHADVPADAWRAIPGRSRRTPAEELLVRLAGVLPGDVRVHAAGLAPPGFDARFSALRRRYAYRVGDAPSGVPPLRRRDVLAHRRPLDVEGMHAAARNLLGLHDFAAFCRRRDGATTIRTLLDYSWAREPATGFLTATVVADAFCHSMVRALVGAVLPVGEGRRPVEWPAEVLAAAVRHPGVAVVPPHGLVLEEVTYPADDRLGERAEQARQVRQLRQVRSLAPPSGS
jgi:tRNA pseudouridine38-40 synthase